MRVILTSGKHPRRRRAISMVEVLLAAVVLSFGVAAISAALVGGLQQAKEAMDMQRATTLAQALMEEILAQPYDDPNGGVLALGPDAGESTRTTLDNVDDYHSYTEAPGSLLNQAGAAWPDEYQDFNRSVSIATASLQPPGFASAVTGLTVTLSVELEGRTMITLTRFVADPDPDS